MIFSITTSLFFLAVAGYLLARHIYKRKQEKKPLICPLRTSCDTVVRSDYSTINGIPLERVGMAYYGVMIATYGFLALFPTIHSTLVSFILVVMSASAFIFSFYLVLVQAFALRAWCTWCLMSAGICTLIFSLSLISHETSFVAILAEHKTLVVIIHAIAATIGVGAATITDIFFFRFLEDRKISVFEAGVLNTLSRVIWIAIAILLVSGLGLYLPNAEVLGESSKFLVKMIGVAVLIANGVALNLVVSPRLMHISFNEEHAHMKGELIRLRKISFALGAISISSWYMIFILGNLRKVNLPFSTLLLLYFGIVVLAVVMSQIFDYFFSKKNASAGSS